MGRYAWIAVNALLKYQYSTLGSIDGHWFNALPFLSVPEPFLPAPFSYPKTLLLRNWIIPTKPQNTKLLSMILSMWNIHRIHLIETVSLWMRGSWRAARIRAKLSPWKGNKLLVWRLVLTLAQKCVSEPCGWGERFLECLSHLTIACCFQK